MVYVNQVFSISLKIILYRVAFTASP